MTNWDWLKNSSQWMNSNQGRFSAIMSDLAGIVAPQNPFAASGLGRKLSERDVYAKAMQEKQGERDDARRILEGVLSGKIKPSPKEQPGFTGLSLKHGKAGETLFNAEYTLSGAEDPDKAPTQGQSALANQSVPPASSSNLPWDMSVGPNGTPDFSYRDPDMQGRIPPPEAVQQMLALRAQGQQPRQPQVVNTQGQPVETPKRSDFNPAELGILPTEKQAQLAQMGRYNDELGLALAKLMGDRDYQQQRLAMDWAQLNRPGKPAPSPEPELYYDAEGNPSWHLPGDSNIPQDTYPVGKRPKAPDAPVTTLDPARQEQYRQDFYNLLSSAMTDGQVPTGQQDRRGNPIMRPVDEQTANQLTEMSMNMGRGRFYAYEKPDSSSWFSFNEGPLDFYPNGGTPTITEYRIAPEYATQLPRIREAAKFDGWPQAIAEMKARGVLIPVEADDE